MGDVGPVDSASAFAGAGLAEREQATEVSIAGAVERVGENPGAVGEIEPATDDQTHAGHLGGFMGADDAGDGVVVANRDGLDAGEGGLAEQLLAAGGAAQEAEVGRRLQLGVADLTHPNSPCIHQVRSPEGAHSPSPRRKTQNRSPVSVSSWK